MPFDDEMTERERWADDHGYQQYRCPGCHKLFYSDSGPVGNCPCGYMPEGAEPDSEMERRTR
jgi:hypothetical protein